MTPSFARNSCNGSKGKRVNTQIIEWGWFGFGRVGTGVQGNLFPSLCMGFVRFSWCKGHLADALKAVLK